jgi:Cu/Ag efflux protein CusF
MRMCVVVAVCLLTLAGCSKSEPVAEKITKSTVDEPLKKYELKGEIARVDNENKIATIKHEAIGDWMGPMTMDFPVKDSADFAKLAPGKPVNATVFVQGMNYWVGEVKETPPAPAK